MSNEKQKRCIVYTEEGECGGIVANEFEEVGGPDDGAIFALIYLDNGQTVTVKILTPEE
tara:strand:+ start:3832 stop:4008 length:177 start_codon:yes stop_codon:yes gene_type:complete